MEESRENMWRSEVKKKWECEVNKKVGMWSKESKWECGVKKIKGEEIDKVPDNSCLYVE